MDVSKIVDGLPDRTVAELERLRANAQAKLTDDRLGPVAAHILDEVEDELRHRETL